MATPSIVRHNEEGAAKIITDSAPSDSEVYLPPPGINSETPTATDVVLEPSETPKEDDGKIHWDFSKLLNGGTLGDLSANLHHGVAVGTGWDGWDLTPDEKNQYDKVLGTILEPLLAKVEYLPLVLGILALVALEGAKIGNYFKWKREEDIKKRPQVPIPAPVGGVPVPPQYTPPVNPVPVVAQTPPTFNQGSTNAVSPGTVVAGMTAEDSARLSRFNNSPVAIDGSGRNLDADLPQARGRAIDYEAPDLGLPGISPQQAASLRKQ